MKYCLVILICLMTTRSYSQAYVPFPDSNAYWTILAWSGATVPAVKSSIYINGDTLINSQLYHKTYVYDTVFSFTNYSHAFRQDTAARKIFMIHPNFPVEYLAYDFSMTVGDTFVIDSALNFSFVVSVDDSVLVQGQYRRHLHLLPVNYPCLCSCEPDWIEGIGSLYGFFSVACSELGFQDLICFSQNNVPVYPDTGTCEFFSSVSDPPPSKQELNLYPNPVDDLLTIEFEDAMNGTLNLTLRDVPGKIILTKEIALSGTNHTNSITLTSLKPGIYFLEAVNNENKWIKRLVKNQEN